MKSTFEKMGGTYTPVSYTHLDVYKRQVSDIEYIANNIMLMKDGELFYAGTAEDLVSSMREKV